MASATRTLALVTVAVIVGALGVFTAAPAYAATHTVCPGGTCDFTSIQDAVDAAGANDTITIAAGTYTEQVIFDDLADSVELLGAGVGATIIQAPATLVPEHTLNSVVVVKGATTDVVLRDLTIAGPRSGDVLDNALLVVDGGSVDFRNGAVADIRDNPLSGAQRGHAIMIGTSAAHGGASTGSAILENLSLTNYQKTGLIVRAGSVVEVRNSSFDGRGLNCTIATNAIQVQGEATIEGNHIFGHQYASDGVSPCGSDTSSSAAGILVFDPSGPLVIDGNLIEGTQIGIYLSASAATTAPATVSNNTLIGLSSVPMNSWGLQSLWAPNTLAITGNTFTGFVSGIHTNSTGGGETITSNTFTGNNRGVRFSVSPQQFAANSIVGNTSVGVDSTVPVAGGPNWWGCSEGPGNTGCDSLGGSFTEPEWLVLTMSLNQCTVVQGETATATVSLTRTSADAEFTAAFVPPTNSTQSGSSGVAVTPATGATSSGQLPVTITGVQPGSATASATVHNATVSVPGGVGCASLAVLRGALAATGADPLTVALASGLGALALFAGVLCLSAVRRLRRAS